MSTRSDHSTRSHFRSRITQQLMLCAAGFLGLAAAWSASERHTPQEPVAKSKQQSAAGVSTKTKADLPKARAKTDLPETGGAQEQHTSLAQLELKGTPQWIKEQFLGLTPYGTAIILSETEYNSNVGDIIRWDVSQQKEVGKTPLTKWLDSYDLRLSPDGRLLVTNANNSDQSFLKVRPYRVTALHTSDLTTAGAFDIAEDKDITGYIFLPDDPEHVVLKVLSIIPFKEKDGTDNATFGKDRFEWMNLETGKIDKTLSYSHARGCDQVRFSPDKKYLACLFTDEHFDFIDDKTDRYGVVDILDPETGKILWHLQGTAKQPVGYPLFFISPTQFVSSDTLFDIAAKTAKPWSAVNASRRCVAEVPGHPAYAMFLTETGTELRNWKTDRLVKSWPTLKEQSRISFAPDLKIFSFKRGQNVQFWKFDPTWVKS